MKTILTSSKQLTWREILTIDPRLRAVIAEANRLESADWRDYERLKNQLYRLVGFRATRPELRTTEAYELAIRNLIDATGI